MFKAQILFGAPLFILWPLWRGNWRGILRWISGFISTAALITSGWLLRVNDQLDKHALLWVIGAAVTVPALFWAIHPKFPRYIRITLAVISLALITTPLYHTGWHWLALSIFALGALASVIRFAPTKALAYTTAAWIAIALFSCVPIFNGSMTWFQVGIAFGTRRYNTMARGTDNNLAAILEKQWGWNVMDSVFTVPPGHIADWLGSHLPSSDPHFVFSPHQPFDIPLKYILCSVYFLAIILCSLGAAFHSKRASPRFLVAITAPWIVFFAVLTQMHQRYLLWGAGFSAATVALGPGFLLLHLLLTTIAWSQEAADMLGRTGYRDSTIYSIIHGWSPGIGWAVLLCAAIFVYIAVTPGPKRRS